jgi:hypothetical protein
MGGRGGDGNTLGIPGDGGDGGAGVQLLATSNGSPTLVVYDSILAGGPGGTGLPPASDGAAGPPSNVVAGTIETPVAFARTFGAEAVVRDGASTALTFVGQPFDLVWHILAIDTNPLTTYLPDALGAIHPGGTPFLFKFRGLLNAAGSKTLNVNLTATGLDYLPFWEQGLMFNQTEGFVATNPRYIAFLDASIP